MTRLPGVVAVKAALHELGLLPSAAVRLPHVPATEDEVAVIRAAMGASGLL
jgi:4-hydroxy-tetrahydrodipicolinate synthase